MFKPMDRFGFSPLLLWASTFLPGPVSAQKFPPPLQPAPDELLLLQVHAKGDQIYSCSNDQGRFAWTVKAPEAKLFDKSGKPFGRHFAGPSWEANDGSRIVGKAVASVPSPEPDAIPWLLVNILSHEGSGVLSAVKSVRRAQTGGGKAPLSGCDPGHVGQEVRVPYTAEYFFYAAK